MSKDIDRYTVIVSEDERRKGVIEPEVQKKIIDMFKRDGIVVLKNVFDDRFITDLHEYYMLNYGQVKESPIPSSRMVDHERHFIVPRITSSFNDVRFYGNPIVINLLFQLLGQSWSYQSITTVMSYPGSKAQAVHIDAPLLFNSEEMSPSFPVYALTVVVPLVDIDDINGGTRVWPGSHLKPHVKNGVLDRSSIRQEDSVVMQAKRGDCFLMDYRITHGGEPNNSLSPRPIVTFICVLPWFHDGINYGHIPEVIMTPSDVQRMPKEFQQRFKLPKNVELYSNIGDKHIEGQVNASVSRNSPCHCGSGLRYKQCHGKV
jgi:ectoine hydroxylase-related dioxygenase (phytanoyl-CoA dioxygenase family)